MRVRHLRSYAAAAGTAALLAGIALAPVLAGPASAGSASAATVRGGVAGQPRSTIRHVLLLSVDGLHQQDLAWYVRQYPCPARRLRIKKPSTSTRPASTPGKA